MATNVVVLRNYGIVSIKKYASYHEFWELKKREKFELCELQQLFDAM